MLMRRTGRVFVLVREREGGGARAAELALPMPARFKIVDGSLLVCCGVLEDPECVYAPGEWLRAWHEGKSA